MNFSVLFLLSLSLLCLVSDSIELCLPSGNSSFCSSLEITECLKHTNVTCTNTHHYVALKKTHLAACKDVRSLAIQNCLSDIEGSPFSDLTSLLELRLEDNMLMKINRYMFSNTSRQTLTVLYLANNNIREIEEVSFQDIPHLRIINLKKNKLNTIKYNVFNNLPVDTLNLADNAITTIEGNALSDIPELWRLFLSNNRLGNFVAREILNNSMEILAMLDLSRNILTALNGSMLEGLENLIRLHVSHNRISVIHPGTFAKTPRLLNLELTGNYLTTLKYDIFPDEPDIFALYIGENRLTYLEPTVLFKLRKLKEIEIGGNPWQCSCFDLILWWISTQKIMSANSDKFYLEFGTQPICVVGEPETKVCLYSNDTYYYQKYLEA